MKSRSRSYRLDIVAMELDVQVFTSAPHVQHNQSSPGLNMQFLPTASTSYGCTLKGFTFMHRSYSPGNSLITVFSTRGYD